MSRTPAEVTLAADPKVDGGGAVFHDPVAMAHVASIVRTALARKPADQPASDEQVAS